VYRVSYDEYVRVRGFVLERSIVDEYFDPRAKLFLLFDECTGAMHGLHVQVQKSKNVVLPDDEYYLSADIIQRYVDLSREEDPELTLEDLGML